MNRQEIKKDEVAAFFKRGIFFFQNHESLFGYIGVAVASLLAVFLLYKGFVFFRGKSDNNAYRQIVAMAADKAKVSEKATQLKALSKKGTLSSSGLLILAESYLEKGEYDQAQRVVDTIDKGGKSLLSLKANLLQIQLYQIKGEYQKAIDFFRGQLQPVLSKASKEIPYDALLYKMGEIYRQKGDAEGARQTWEKLVKEHPESPYGMLAQRELYQSY